MSEKPILFNGSMVQAILDGGKTQTRRVIKPQPIIKHGAVTGPGKWTPKHIYNWPVPDWCMIAARYHCPYGRGVGFNDTLWVRETWRTCREDDDLKPSELDPENAGDLWWEADGSSRRRLNAKPGKVRPSIYMPRWASRITLRVKSVRVERVQEINEEDARAEGVSPMTWISHPENAPAYRVMFAPLWNSIHGAGAWERNEFCWVVEFEKGEVGE